MQFSLSCRTPFSNNAVCVPPLVSNTKFLANTERQAKLCVVVFVIKIFFVAVGLERGPLNLCEELLERKVAAPV
jgi:hypothetical protein